MKRNAKIILPVAVLIGGIFAAMAVIKARPQVERQEASTPPPLVRVLDARRQEVELEVRSQGTVAPKTSSTLVAQVSGRISWVSPAFAEGGFFRRGQRLIQIEEDDYRVAVSQAEAQLAQAQVRVELENAEADLARREWQELGGGDASPLTLREPQLAEAQAARQAAEAALAKARLDLDRTRVSALFDGRVRSQLVDLGQFVNRGSALGAVFATDTAEIRLPVPRDQLAFLDLDSAIGTNGELISGPAVVLEGESGGESYRWPARIVRTGSELDPKTRMLPLFARIDDPFRLRSGAQGPSIPMGLFVEATIAGRVLPEVVVLPREALRDGDRVLVVDDQSRLRFRPVDIRRLYRNQLIVRGGLEEGDIVCISPLEAAVEGMEVRTLTEVENSQTAKQIGEGR